MSPYFFLTTFVAWIASASFLQARRHSTNCDIEGVVFNLLQQKLIYQINTADKTKATVSSLPKYRM